jgi:hypothetical protein
MITLSSLAVVARKENGTQRPAGEMLLDRRAQPRYPVNNDTTCPFVMPLGDELGPAKVRDISTEGVGLLMASPLEPGTLLVIALNNAARNFCCTQLVQVVHASQVVGGMYLVGCVFLNPLTYEELRAYLM